jgi:hypothetical protein
MTRKDYVEVASILNRLAKSIEPKTSESKAFDIAVGDLCEMFLADNPRFDSLRFVEAVHRA